MVEEINPNISYRIRKLGLIFSKAVGGDRFIMRLTTENGPVYAVVDRKILKSTIRLLSRKSFLEHAYGLYEACDLVERIVSESLEDEMGNIKRILGELFIYKRDAVPTNVEKVLLATKKECQRIGHI